MSRRTLHPFLLSIILLALPVGMVSLLPAGEKPGSGSVPGTAESELQQREAKLAASAARIQEGRALAKQGKANEALACFEEARRNLPDAPATAQVRDEAAQAFAETGTAEARRLAAEGRYAEAKALLERVLAPEMRPDHKQARVLQEQIADPDRYPPAASPEQAAKVAQVEATLRKAESSFLLADYDNAAKAYDEVLTIDPYNTAARAGLERVEGAIIDSLEPAYNQTRATMLRQVAEKWETENPEFRNKLAAEALGQAGTGEEIATRNRALALDRKMRAMQIPRVRLEGSSLEDAVNYLTSLSRTADTSEPNPSQRGISILLQLGPDTDELTKKALSTPINLQLDNVPLRTVLDYVAQQAGLGVRVESYAVLLVPPGDADKSLFTRTYNVPPDFISSVPVDAGGGGGAAVDPFANPAAAAGGGGGLSLKRMSPKDFLSQSGISFPTSSFAVFDARTSTVTMRNTSTNHELLESMVDKARASLTPQVSIEARMIEVSENNMKELGFDWLVGAFSMSHGIYGSGAGSDLTSGGALPTVNPATGQPVGSYSLTSGNRSGSTAVTEASLDRLLDVQDASKLGGSTLRAPAALSMAGVLTQPDFQVLLRALAQKKGKAFLSSPNVVTRSGTPARIEIIREFIYPTEYDPPELPNSVGNNYDPNIPPDQQDQGGGQLGFPVTPATPTAFEMRPLGTILEAEPVVSPDGSVIEMNFNLSHVEFSGFVNYGQPITTPIVNALGQPDLITLTDNRIFQPVFEIRHLKTSTSVYDGQTIVVGGFSSENRTLVDDKTPLLGDLPLLGRFFKSNVESSDRRILLFLMTVSSLDASGSPVRSQPHATAATPR